MALPDDVDPRELDPDARKELRSLTKEAAALVAQHLVMAGRLIDADPEQALAHARAARAMAARIGVVREAVGLAAYAMEQWTEALAELRAARRITGRPDHLAVFADCERALGRPERALAYADDPDVPGLPQDERVELVMVLAGARSDLGQQDAAVLMLQEPAQRTSAQRPWAARLWYAYADALLGASRAAESRDWFSRVVDVDVDGSTDAVDRLLILDGVQLVDLALDDDDEGESAPSDPELSDYIRRTYGGPQAAVTRESQQDVETEIADNVSTSRDGQGLESSVGPATTPSLPGSLPGSAASPPHSATPLTCPPRVNAAQRPVPLPEFTGAAGGSGAPYPAASGVASRHPERPQDQERQPDLEDEEPLRLFE